MCNAKKLDYFNNRMVTLVAVRQWFTYRYCRQGNQRGSWLACLDCLTTM